MSTILVTRSSMPPMEEYINEIKELWDSHWITNMGNKHKVFQSELLKYLGVEKIEILVNGHMALELTLQAMKFPTGGRGYYNSVYVCLDYTCNSQKRSKAGILRYQ